jgi:glutamate racemase
VSKVRPSSHREGAIGIFDSGIGGLTVTQQIMQALPTERLLYFADSAHLPYGQRSLREVRDFSFAITEALLAKGAKIIVVACNTASGAALHELRQGFPDVPFVGMEPAVKPAAETTRSRVVGVIATPATFQSQVYASVVERFAQDVTVLHQPCPGLVEQIEAGEFDTPRTEQMLRGWLEPMMAKGIDVLVLGCTHYPFVLPLIERITGPEVRVIDPAPAVARQVVRVLQARELQNSGTGHLTAYTSGPKAAFIEMLGKLRVTPDEVRQAFWIDGKLTLP